VVRAFVGGGSAVSGALQDR